MVFIDSKQFQEHVSSLRLDKASYRKMYYSSLFIRSRKNPHFRQHSALLAGAQWELVLHADLPTEFPQPGSGTRKGKILCTEQQACKSLETASDGQLHPNSLFSPS